MEGSGSFVDLLKPVLDTYMDASVALIGCRSAGLERESCEYDLLVVRPERNPPATLRIGGGFVDLVFSTEAELARARAPEFSLSLAAAKPIRDGDLLLSTACSAARELVDRNHLRCSEERLASSLKAIGRSEEAAGRGAATDADFWLMSAGYELARAWLHSSGVTPAPSHLLSQLRQLSRGPPGLFEAFSRAVGLGAASRTSCQARLEGLGVIYDLRELPGAWQEGASPESVRAAYELLGVKANAALLASQPADSYCFLGLEVARWLPEVAKTHFGRREASTITGSMPGAGEGLIARSVVSSLGLSRSLDEVGSGLAALRNKVSALARRT